MKDSVQIQNNKSDINITDEISLQENIRNNTFLTGEFITSKLLECKVSGTDEIEYNNIKYKNIKMSDNVMIGEKAHMPIFIYKYRNRYKSVTSGVYGSKEKAQKEIKEYNKISDDFKFKFDSNNKIKYINPNVNQKYIKMYENIGKFAIIITLLHLMSIIFVSALMYINDIYILVFIPIILSMLIISEISSNYKNNMIKYDELIDLDLDNIDLSNRNECFIEEQESYKIIKANIILDKSGLILESEELDCKWLYKRDINDKLDDNGLYLLKNIQEQDNYCILSVKKYTSSNKNFVSENGKWKIDIEATFD